MNRSNPIAALCAAILFCAPALGGTLSAEYSLTGVTGVPVTFTFNDVLRGPYGAGEVTGKRFGGTDTLVTTDMNNNFNAFCVELGEDIFAGVVVTHADVLVLPGSTTSQTGDPDNIPVTFNGNRPLMLGRLWGTYQPVLGSMLGLVPDAAALQLAIWEASFDTDLTLIGTLAGPELMFADLMDPIVSLAETMLANVRDLNNTLVTRNLLLITDDDLQDLIAPTDDPPFLSPEPSSLVLAIMAGLALVGLIRRVH